MQNKTHLFCIIFVQLFFFLKSNFYLITFIILVNISLPKTFHLGQDRQNKSNLSDAASKLSQFFFFLADRCKKSRMMIYKQWRLIVLLLLQLQLPVYTLLSSQQPPTSTSSTPPSTTTTTSTTTSLPQLLISSPALSGSIPPPSIPSLSLSFLRRSGLSGAFFCAAC